MMALWRIIIDFLFNNGNVMIKALCYKPEGHEFDSRWIDFFLIYLILPAALGRGIYSASNINEF
jgi:hypothetical protein